MKIFPSAFVIFFVISCDQASNNKQQVLQNQIDSLRNRLDQVYAPGIGEYMSSIQMHHAKLWFAGKNGNWDLANFEIEEIQESLDNIQKHCADSPEIRSLSMIYPPLDSVKLSIAKKNIELFKSDFNLLTNTCNNCHKSANHAFNVIKIPDGLPVSNQVFEKQSPKN
jgi:hypothetical protein